MRASTSSTAQEETFGFGQLMKGWTVMDRLSETKVPTLMLAGRDDFVFPPERHGPLPSVALFALMGSSAQALQVLGHAVRKHREVRD
jgi:pimeloyl-ACP methyl ester carboxylesterase